MKVPAQVYDFSPNDIDWITSELRRLLESKGFLTMGKYGEQFEQEFARYHGARYSVATNSGTAALEIILRTLNVAGGEVVVPTNTFAATAFAVIRAGALPIFADIQQDMTLDPADAEKRVRANTRAIITVHIGGLVSPATRRLAELCRTRNIFLMEDAAHAHGSAHGGEMAGTLGIAGAFSFFSTKVMTTGEGGMILTSDEGVYRRAQLLRDQAKVGGANYHETLGYNWRMPEMQAIMGLAQLRRLDEFIARRQYIAAIYDRELDGISQLTPLRPAACLRHNYYKYFVILNGPTPQRIKDELKRRYDIALAGFTYELPLHQQPAFRDYAQGSLPVAEDLCRRHICLPIYPSLTDAQARYVAQSLREVVSSYAD